MLNFHFMILVKPALVGPGFQSLYDLRSLRFQVHLAPASVSSFRLRDFRLPACSGCLFIAGKLLQSFRAACIVALGDLLRGSSAWNRVHRPDGGDLRPLSVYSLSNGSLRPRGGICVLFPSIVTREAVPGMGSAF